MAIETRDPFFTYRRVEALLFWAAAILSLLWVLATRGAA
jgi:hypothetical protein